MRHSDNHCPGSRLHYRPNSVFKKTQRWGGMNSMGFLFKHSIQILLTAEIFQTFSLLTPSLWYGGKYNWKQLILCSKRKTERTCPTSVSFLLHSFSFVFNNFRCGCNLSITAFTSSLIMEQIKVVISGCFSS